MRDPHDIMTLVLPTNEPETFDKFFYGGLHNLKDAAPIITIAINFQHPWTHEAARKRMDYIESLGFKVVRDHNYYDIAEKGAVPFNQIRYDAARLSPESTLYVLTDDDFYYNKGDDQNPFSAGEQYIYCADYMMRHPECGTLLMRSTRRGGHNKIKLNGYLGKYITDGGIILRTLGEDGLIVPDDAVSLVGSDEEKVAAAARLSRGWYTAEISNSKVDHYENHKTGEVVSGAKMYSWNTFKILEQNSIKYIREHYNESYEGRNNYDVIDPQMYLDAGGLIPGDSLSTNCYADYNEVDIYGILNSLVEDYLEGRIL